jgi:hypothetical protein
MAIRIDTRAIEFNSGLLAMAVGIVLTIPPNDVYLGWPSTHFWGWVYLVWGFFSCIFSTYGPFPPRKYTSLIGVYLWSFIAVWIFENHQTHDKVWVASLPYLLIASSSIFTYLGLWRYRSDWNYYNESFRDN